MPFVEYWKLRNIIHEKLELMSRWTSSWAANRRNTCARVSFLIKLQAYGLWPATLLKKRLWHWCFPVNFAIFLRAPFLQDTSGRLLLPPDLSGGRAGGKVIVPEAIILGGNYLGGGGVREQLSIYLGGNCPRTPNQGVWNSKKGLLCLLLHAFSSSASS